mmetsp:Transcript_8766/g.25699  ORF Transcript_8766/g.25699 Transcript_8766/m.25699 type:complete len:286 (-) Transcript_8766:1340-2197(-)
MSERTDTTQRPTSDDRLEKYMPSAPARHTDHCTRGVYTRTATGATRLYGLYLSEWHRKAYASLQLHRSQLFLEQASGGKAITGRLERVACRPLAQPVCLVAHEEHDDVSNPPRDRVTAVLHLARKKDGVAGGGRVDRTAESAEPRPSAVVLSGVVEGDGEAEQRLVRVRGQGGLLGRVVPHEEAVEDAQRARQGSRLGVARREGREQQRAQRLVEGREQLVERRQRNVRRRHRVVPRRRPAAGPRRPCLGRCDVALASRLGQQRPLRHKHPRPLAKGLRSRLQVN